MDLYTIILDFDGGTYINQIESDSARKAAINWAIRLEIKSIPGLGPSSKKAIIKELEEPDNTPIALDRIINAWCSSFTVRGKLGLINIIKTKKQ